MNKSKKNKKILIKNTTPKKNILMRNIFHNSKKSVNLNNLKNINKKSLKKSFSPKINKLLISYNNNNKKDFSLCQNNLLYLKISNSKKCLKYNSKKVQQFLLENLKTIKNINCNLITPPKQILSNCWFNTMFVTFFISDKGRKFFKYLRQLMILGKTIKDVPIPKELAKSFFILNLAIEAATNPNLKKIAFEFNTNLLIKNIYNTINNNKLNSLNLNSKIPNINESGNPLDYYIGIINYLNNKNINLYQPIIKIFDITTSASNIAIENMFTREKIIDKPDIIVLELIDEVSKIVTDKNIELNIFGVKYILDSAIVRDKDKQHFCSLLTCNKDQFAFDGASFSRLSKMTWKNLINQKKIWNFKGHNLSWSFRSSYQSLFYYRI